MIDEDLPNGLFITGTDTGIGKTHSTCLIARQLIKSGIRAAAYKPVCSGALNWSPTANRGMSDTEYKWDDIERLKSAVGCDLPDSTICPQRFLAPLAPPIAARLENRTVDFQKLVDGFRAFQNHEIVLIEGAGGWLSPVTETQTVADLAGALNRPVLIVARSRLGTINHTLMTIECIRSRGLRLLGVLLNDVTPSIDDLSCQTNADEIEARSGVPVFGTIPFGNHFEIQRNGVPMNIHWKNLIINGKTNAIAKHSC